MDRVEAGIEEPLDLNRSRLGAQTPGPARSSRGSQAMSELIRPVAETFHLNTGLVSLGFQIGQAFLQFVNFSHGVFPPSRPTDHRPEQA